MFKEKELIRFLSFAGLLYGTWFMLYEFFIKPQGSLDHLITQNITEAICRLLYWSGHEATYSIGRKLGETYIYVDSQLIPVVRIGASCNGLELLVFFSIFVICYPGRVLYKVSFIAGGNILIHGLNILRNYGLTMMAVKKYEHMELFHRYIFVFIMYGIIFLLWMLWANYLSQLHLKSETGEQ